MIHKTLSETLQEVIVTCSENLDTYKPSFHVLNTYHEYGIVDLETCMEEFRRSMISYIQVLLTRDFGNIDFDETNPGPYYYMDTSSVTECFASLETRLLQEAARRYMNTFMSEMKETLENMTEEQL